MAIRMKSTTVLVGTKRISWFNTNCLTFKKVKTGYEFTVYWKYKASVKKETFETTMQENEINKYFARFGLVAFHEWYINLDKILIITEDQIFGPVEKTKVRIVLVDGFEINKTIEATAWSWWKMSYL